MNYLPPNTDAYVTLTGAQNPKDDPYFNAATVSMVVQDVSSTEVVSSQTLTYITSSNGNYEVSLDKALFSGLTLGRTYKAICTASESGVDREFQFVFEYGHEPV